MKHEDEGTTTSDEYQKLIVPFSRKHQCAMDPWPEELIQSFRSIDEDPTVAMAMLACLIFTFSSIYLSYLYLRFGPSDFRITGSLKDYSVVPILHNITASTLVISSPIETVQPISVKPFFEEIKHVKWVEFQDSTHLPQFEDPDRHVSFFRLDSH